MIRRKLGKCGHRCPLALARSSVTCGDLHGRHMPMMMKMAVGAAALETREASQTRELVPGTACMF